MGWERAASVEELERGPVVLKRPSRQVVVFRHAGRCHAIDNRCPHEGYPLAQGTLDEAGVLTCQWHNWRFRLSDGRCLLGGDHVRSYPTREEAGSVWVDLSDASPAEARRTALEGLRSAFDERDYGRTCRELARLHVAGLDMREGVEAAIVWSHDRLEYGTTHAYAATADWLGEHERRRGELDQELVCLAEAVDHMANDALRHPLFPYAAPAARWDAGAFADAVEGQRTAEAESLIGRALDEGLRSAEIEQVLARAALAHYNDFGHALIYVHKTVELAARVGREAERALALALARHLTFTTREDLLPEFRAYAETLATLPAPRPDGCAGSRPTVPFPATTREAFAWLAVALGTHPVAAVFDALLEALARNLLHFDVAFERASDRPVKDNIGWLDFTHALTFAEALHALARRHPELWPAGLLQMACFLGRNRPYLDLGSDAAVGEMRDAEALLAAVRTLRIDHGLRDPIFSAHVLKTSVAVERELEGASAPCRTALLTALQRFTGAPLKQKHPLRLARQALDLVGRDRPAG